MSGTKHVTGSLINLGFYCLLRYCSTVPEHGVRAGKVKPKLNGVSLSWLQFVCSVPCLLLCLTRITLDWDHSWGHWGSPMEWCWHFEELCSVNCHRTKCQPALSSPVPLQGLSPSSVLKTLKHKEFCWTGGLISAYLWFPGECVGFFPHFLSHLLT